MSISQAFDLSGSDSDDPDRIPLWVLDLGSDDIGDQADNASFTIAADLFLSRTTRGFLGNNNVLNDVKLVSINTADPNSGFARTALELLEFGLPDDPNVAPLTTQGFSTEPGGDIRKINLNTTVDTQSLFSFDFESGAITAYDNLFDRLDLDESIILTFELGYTGAVGSREVNIAILGGFDPVERIRGGDSNKVGNSSVTLIDLNQQFATVDSNSVDVANLNFAQDAGGDPATGISEWFDLDGGGRIRFLPDEGAPANAGFQSQVEFDPDGDFDDLNLQESRTVVATLGLHSSGFGSVDPQTVRLFDVSFEVINRAAELEVDVIAIDDAVSFSKSPGELTLALNGETGISVNALVLENDTVGGQISGFLLLNPAATTLFDAFSARQQVTIDGLQFEVVTDVDIPSLGAEFAIRVTAQDDVIADLAPGESLTRSIEYAVGAISPFGTQVDVDRATLTATVFAPTDLNTIAVDDFAVGLESDPSFTIDLLSNDFNPIQAVPLTVTHIDGRELDENGFATSRDGLGVVAQDDGTLTIINNQGDGRFESLGVGDVEFINFDYTIRSAQGFAEATAVLAVEGENDAPFADFLTPDLLLISETETATLNILDDAFDPDETDVLQVISVEGVDLVDGIVTVAGDDGGQFTVAADGTLTFDPLTDFFDLDPGETRISSLDYVISDPEGATDAGTASIGVFGIEQSAVATDDTVQVDEDLTTALQIFANDIDPDGGLNGAVVSAINGVELVQDESVTFDLPSGASLLILPESSFLAYTPDASANALAAGEIGLDTFTYTLSNGNVSTTAKVDVEIVGENDAPVAVNDTAFLVGAGPLQIDVLANDFDPDGDRLSIDRFLSVSRGTAEVSATRLGDVVQFTPDNDDLGLSVISYIVTDESGAERNALLTVTIVPATSIFGTEGNDNPLLGDGDDDTIFALAGDDVVRAGRGADNVFAADGDDTVDAGRGRDTVDGGAGADSISGRAGFDRLSGGEGDDIIEGGNGSDTVFGGADNDELRGNRGADTLFGGDGDDTIFGNRGADQIEGGAGDDTINGGRGQDEIEGGSGNDQLNGGLGLDQFVFDGEFDQDEISAFNTLQDTLVFRNLAADDVTIEQVGLDLLVVADGDETQGAVRLLGVSGLEVDDLVFA